MTLLESAVVMSWIAIALLSIGFAVVVRQTTLLARVVTPDFHRRAVPDNPLVGLRLPTTTALEPWLDDQCASVILYISAECRACDIYLRACIRERSLASRPVVIVSSGGYAKGGHTWPSRWVLLEQASAEHSRMNVVAVPYFAVVDSDHIVRSAGVVPSVRELVSLRDDANEGRC